MSIILSSIIGIDYLKIRIQIGLNAEHAWADATIISHLCEECFNWDIELVSVQSPNILVLNYTNYDK